MKYLNIFALAIVSFIVFSCTKNDETTVILLGKETYVQDIIEMIPDSLQNSFLAEFGEIHEGYIPPKIEGDYIVNRKQRVYSNTTELWPLDVYEREMPLTIKDQHNREAIFILEEAFETRTDTVYIIGHDNYFTIYGLEEKSLFDGANTINIKRAVLIKGEICDDGIKDLYFANIILDVHDDSDDTTGIPISYDKGVFFIYRDEDGLAERIAEN